MSSPRFTEGRVCFIVERPLQIMIAHSICAQLGIRPATVELLVADRFSEAHLVSERLREMFGYRTRVFQDYPSAMRFAQRQTFDHIFIHWDMGVRTQLILSRLKTVNRNICIHVYEEGVGTYRTDVYSPVKRCLLRVLGFPVNVGGSHFVNSIFVYDRTQYISGAIKYPDLVLEIERPLKAVILDNWSQFGYIFDSDQLYIDINRSNDEECYIYLSGWHFDRKDIKDKFVNGAFNILKLHPHRADRVSSVSGEFYLAKSVIPAELLIVKCAEHFSSVVVYHNKSSVARYMDFKNVRFIS